MTNETALSWTRAQRALHWWTAALILVAFPLGWIMVAIPLRALLLKFLLYQLHKTLGILVLVLVAIRAGMRMTRRRPDWDTDLPDWQRRSAASVHLTLYLLLLLVPLLGYLTAATAPSRIPTLFLGIVPIPHVLSPDQIMFDMLRFWHRWAAILVVALAIVHIAAALHNHRRGRPSLVRMWTGRAASSRSRPFRFGRADATSGMTGPSPGVPGGRPAAETGRTATAQSR